jgi:hypothetical protein
VADALRGDLPGLGRAGAIMTGVGATAAGYAAGWVQRHARKQPGHRPARPRTTRSAA